MGHSVIPYPRLIIRLPVLLFLWTSLACGQIRYGIFQTPPGAGIAILGNAVTVNGDPST